MMSSLPCNGMALVCVYVYKDRTAPPPSLSSSFTKARQGTEIYWARQQVSERLVTVKSQMPDGMGIPELGPLTSGLGEIYQYVIFVDDDHKEKYSSTDLRSIQDWVVKRQLTGVKGVIEVNSSGGYLKQYEVAFSPDKLKSMNVTLEELFQAIKNNTKLDLDDSLIEEIDINIGIACIIPETQSWKLQTADEMMKLEINEY